MTGPDTFSRRMRVSVLLGLCCFILYNANLRSISAGDCYPARYLPFAILRDHTIFMNPIAKVAAQGRADLAFWMVPLPDGRIVSLYPVTVPVLIAPLYVPAAAHLYYTGWDDARIDAVAKLMEKLSASLIAALSVSLLYLLLRRRARESVAILLALAYGLGTTTWVVSSQALWQHGIAQLLVIAALLLLTTSCSAPRVLALGLLVALIAANRPPDAILAGALAICGLLWAGWRRAWLLIAGAALPTALLLYYNVGVIGRLLGGYGLIGKRRFFEHDLLEGIAGLLVSPTRGLFLFSPFLLFVIPAWRRRFQRNREERVLALAMGISVVVQIIVYAKADWRGGQSWGPRYMTDLLPFLMWMLAPVVSSLNGFRRIVFYVAVAISILIEAIGAFTYSGWMDAPIVSIERGPGAMDAAFDWSRVPFLVSMKFGLAPRELPVPIRGSFDAIESGGGETFAAGWALARHATPWQVAVIVDGRQTMTTRTFVDRRDVRDALHETSPVGWRVPIDTSKLAPGEHSVSAFAWASELGEGHFLGERTLIVRGAANPHASGAPDLDQAAAAAAARIVGHQQPDGSWLTMFTSGTTFREARPEMNTFLTALLIDLLDPVAKKYGLDGGVRHAREHLTRQIEESGLVRYHGLPTGAGIGTLGCVITPDADDTALAWRIAPASDRKRLDNALATIHRYRTAEGLYRNWLAPREEYQCLDPGRDPNPTDIAIQMHLLMLFAEVRPADARALCQSLQRVADEDRVWVYYRKTPLVPLLRMNDLRRAGCALELPERRMQASAVGQQIWVLVARILQDTSGTDAAMARALLRELARDDFAFLRTNPPLLYHNDLTATVPRYYWSEDVGYALWLKLYDRYPQLVDAVPAR